MPKTATGARGRAEKTSDTLPAEQSATEGSSSPGRGLAARTETDKTSSERRSLAVSREAHLCVEKTLPSETNLKTPTPLTGLGGQRRAHPQLYRHPPRWRRTLHPPTQTLPTRRSFRVFDTFPPTRQRALAKKRARPYRPSRRRRQLARRQRRKLRGELLQRDIGHKVENPKRTEKRRHTRRQGPPPRVGRAVDCQEPTRMAEKPADPSFPRCIRASSSNSFSCVNSAMH